MDRRAQPQSTTSGTVEAPVEQIPFTAEGWPVMSRVTFVDDAPEIAWRKVLEPMQYVSEEQRRRALTEHQWVTPPGANLAGFHIDEKIRVVAIQGGWWYRGVHAVEPHGSGAKLTYVVRNVAPLTSRWLAQLIQARAHRKAAALD